MPEFVFNPKAIARRVAWRDLVPMRPIDGIVECLHPLPWVAASWAAAAHHLWPLALPASFMFFLTALRLNHEAIHGHLGFTARGHRLTLHALSAVMLASNHSVAFNHHRHHAYLDTDRDVEGKCGRMSAPRVLAYGPLFPVETHRTAWRLGRPALRRRIAIDLALNVAMIATALASGLGFLLYHVAAMLAAQCLTAFFAVWITHRGCHGHALSARTQRSRLANLVTYNMFLHLEHHLFPAVPVRRLGRLAARIDAAVPGFADAARRVVPDIVTPGRALGRYRPSNPACRASATMQAPRASISAGPGPSVTSARSSRTSLPATLALIAHEQIRLPSSPSGNAALSAASPSTHSRASVRASAALSSAALWHPPSAAAASDAVIQIRPLSIAPG